MPLQQPIIRLRTTSDNNATLTDDPVLATTTLYTFLRSVPTVTETDLAMSEFVHAMSRPGEYSALRRPNTRMVSLLETTVVDGLLRQPPLVSSEWCRRSSEWQTLLTRSSLAVDRVSVHHKERDDESAKTDVSTSLSTTAGPSTSAHVSCSQFHEFCDPYSDYYLSASGAAALPSPSPEYLQQYQHQRDACTPTKSASDCYNERLREDELEYSGGSTQAPDGTSSICDAENIRCSGGGDVGDVGVQGGVDPLIEVVERVRESVGATAVEHLHDRQDRRFKEVMADKFRAVETRLAGTEAAVTAALEESAGTGNIWSPAHSHLKASETYLQELRSRVVAAKALHTVQSFEQETIEIAHCALLSEVAALRGVLLAVHGAVETAEEGIECGAYACREDDTEGEALLIRDLRAVLNPPEEEEGVDG